MIKIPLFIAGILLLAFSVSATVALTMDSGVNLGDKLGVAARYTNATGDPQSNFTCTVIVDKNGSVRDLQAYQTPEVVHPENKLLKTNANGFCYYLLDIDERYAVDANHTVTVYVNNENGTAWFKPSTRKLDVPAWNWLLFLRDNPASIIVILVLVFLAIILLNIVIREARK